MLELDRAWMHLVLSQAGTARSASPFSIGLMRSTTCARMEAY